jgi:SNF2 family DNA or RNA helicase
MWNPAVEDQATDRAHRIVVSLGTVEEAIVARHADERHLVADLLEGPDAAPMLCEER